MTVTRQDIDFLVATARTAADVEIMPRFANLAAADIKTKAHASDFVTVADVAAEEMIERQVRAAWGDDFLFIGEEVMERRPMLIDQLMDAPRAEGFAFDAWERPVMAWVPDPDPALSCAHAVISLRAVLRWRQ